MENQEHMVHEGVSFPVAIVASFIALVAAFLVGGGLVYFVQNASFSVREVALEQEIDSLQERIAHFENQQLSENIPVVSSGVESIDFPIVVYGRSGLLNNTEEGRAEKQILQQKLVRPYIDYHNEDGIELVALYITIPEKIGDEYSVLGIFGSEENYGTEAFLFGIREGEYDYWEPMCMGECEYSDAFRAKYPGIVGE